MQTHAHAEQRFDDPPEVVFARATDNEIFVPTFRGSGPVPGVTRIEELGPEFVVGMERIVHSDDGGTVRETMRVIDAPNRQVYELSDFSPPFRWLVAGARSEWTFTADGEGTHVVWHYTFECTSILAWPVVRPLMFFFARAQQGCLEGLAKA